jgi:iron uptake system EfeUOB component EfeO/EfeM
MLLNISKAMDDGKATVEKLGAFCSTVDDYRKFLVTRQKELQQQIEAEFREMDNGLASLRDAAAGLAKFVEGGNGK